MVMIEAIASGTPVVVYDVTGPADIIEEGKNGYLGDDLAECARKALMLDRAEVAKTATTWSWEMSTELFMESFKRSV